MDASPLLTRWRDWFRFARDWLGYEQREATEYANLRFVEEQNRVALHRAKTVSARTKVA
jgi:hypothetical protein